MSSDYRRSLLETQRLTLPGGASTANSRLSADGQTRTDKSRKQDFRSQSRFAHRAALGSLVRIKGRVLLQEFLFVRGKVIRGKNRI
jgi:hypothetical protein